MHALLQVGDRVRLTAKYRGSQYRPGDTGTIMVALPALRPQDLPAFQVRLDTGTAALYPTFYEDELEPE